MSIWPPPSLIATPGVSRCTRSESLIQHAMGKLGRDHTSFIIAPRRSTKRDAELMARHLTDAGDIRSLHLGEQVEAEILWQAVDLLSGVANCALLYGSTARSLSPVKNPGRARAVGRQKLRFRRFWIRSEAFSGYERPPTDTDSADIALGHEAVS